MSGGSQSAEKIGAKFKCLSFKVEGNAELVSALLEVLAVNESGQSESDACK